MTNTKSNKKKVISEPKLKRPEGRPKIYTREFCLAELESFLAVLKADEKKYTVLTWQDLVRERPYSRYRISEWRNTFAKDYEFSNTLKRIEAELENRLVKIGLRGQANATMVIFCLKNNYKWVDKQEFEGKIQHDPFLDLLKKANIVDD